MGAAIFIQSGKVEIRNCTIIQNTAQGGTAGEGAVAGKGLGAGIFNYQGTLLIQNSAIAQNFADVNPDFEGPIQSAGFNLFSQPPAETTLLPSDLIGIDPRLSMTPATASETPTFPPIADSPLINQGKSIIPEDQRGHPRSLTEPASIGAFEPDLVVRIVAVRLMAQNFELTFNALQGRRYRLQSKTSLNAPWQTSPIVLLGRNDYITTVGPLPSSSTAYFQILLDF